MRPPVTRIGRHEGLGKLQQLMQRPTSFAVTNFVVTSAAVTSFTVTSCTGYTSRSIVTSDSVVTSERERAASLAKRRHSLSAGTAGNRPLSSLAGFPKYLQAISPTS